VAHVAHLRVLAAAGDLALAGETLAHVIDLARRARVPLRAARARLIWLEALRRSGRSRDAQREAEYLTRVARGAPPLLKRAITQAIAGASMAPRAQPHGTGVSGAGAAPGIPSVVPLVRIAHEIDGDKDALQRIVDWIAGELRTSRVDLVSADAGPVSTLISAGCGLATHLGSRVLDAAIGLPVETQGGGREMGIPVRLGSRILAALVCRWPLDREPPPHAADTVELAAAIAAPRVDALLAAARDTARASIAIPDLVGVSAAMADVRRAIERAAAAPFAVLIEGESGVGKELVARAVHQLSPRRERRFCDVNCAAIPDDLMESELFGHARGAFTGAVADRPGLFEEAHDGTIFLDELPDLSPRGQAKLLRVLQQQEVRRIGETFSRKIDVRLVTAANRDMKAEVADGRFRQDLLYRLDVIRVRIPPLRERPEDVAVLAEHFWADAARRVGSAARLTHAVLAELSRYHWPGNVRELQNVVSALAVAAPARGRVLASMLPAAITASAPIALRRLSEARAQFERRCIEVALARASGNRSRAARELGLSRQGLLKTMVRLGVAAHSCNGTGEREE
jgi:DNA-binding NtrC family response regulator